MSSFYKADRSIRYYGDIVIDYFTQGIHFERDRGNTIKEPLKKFERTPHNKTFIGQYTKMMVRYNKLIAIEMVFSAIITRYDEKLDSLRDLMRIIRAQHKTVNFCHSVRGACRMYPIRHKNIINALERNLKSMDERATRNSLFLDVFMKKSNLQPVVDLISSKLGENMYDNIVRVTEEVLDTIPEDTPKDESYRIRDEYYVDWLEKFAAENGIELEYLIREGIEINIAKREVMRDKIRKDRIQHHYEEHRKILSDKNLIRHAEICRALDTGNVENLISINIYNRLISLFDDCDRLYYIAIVRNDSLVYWLENGTVSNSLLNAKIFTSKEEADKAQAQIIADHPKWATEISVLEYYNSKSHQNDPVRIVDRLNNLFGNIKAEIDKYCWDDLYTTGNSDNLNFNRRIARMRYNIDQAYALDKEAYLLLCVSRSTHQMFICTYPIEMTKISGMDQVTTFKSIRVLSSKEECENVIVSVRNKGCCLDCSWAIKKIDRPADLPNVFDAALRDVHGMVADLEGNLIRFRSDARSTRPISIAKLSHVFDREKVDTLYVAGCIIKSELRAQFVIYFPSDADYRNIKDCYMRNILRKNYHIGPTIYSTTREDGDAFVAMLNATNTNIDLDYVNIPITII